MSDCQHDCIRFQSLRIVYDNAPYSAAVNQNIRSGLFCGYLLAKHGYRPILLERGKAVEDRRKDVESFWKTGVLQPDSNVQFGDPPRMFHPQSYRKRLRFHRNCPLIEHLESIPCTVSDCVKDRNGRNREVLRIFARAGAPEEILYEAKPHIGTDLLMRVVRNMREEILTWGGEEYTPLPLSVLAVTL